MLKTWTLLIAFLLASQAIATETKPVNQYHLGAGDVVRVTVYDHPDLLLEAEITPEGYLNMPLINKIKVAGLTFGEAENVIAQKLEQGGYVQDAHVNILISEYRSQLISVIGEVNRPGRYRLEGDTSLVAMLANAGGVSLNGSDQIYVLRDGKQQKFYIPALTSDNNVVGSMMLQPGDQIYVPRFQQVYVYGEVIRPGAYRLEPGMTVMQALSMAGGFGPKADKSGLELQRKDKSGTLKTKELVLTDTLQANDVIYVTESLF